MNKAAVAVTVIVMSAALAACGSSKSNGGSTGKGSGEAVKASGVVAAEKAVAPYIGHPSPFPVTEKLRRLPKGANIAYIDSGTPVGALMWQVLVGAAHVMGVNVERYKAGEAANTVSATMDSVVAKKPSAVIVGAINIPLWARQLKELQEAKIPVVASAVLEGEKYGLKHTLASEADDTRGGKLMADYVVAKMSPQANVVVYDVPELPFTTVISKAFVAEFKARCPRCSVRTAHIPVAEIGSTAPNTIVSDLQAHPETNIAVFADAEAQAGLPQALQAAGIKVQTLGYAPEPTTLQYLKEGKTTAQLGYDLPLLVWTMLDQAAREITGQELSGPEAQGLGVVQFLTPKDITFDPARGWTGYPNFAERLARLWGVAG